MTFSFRCFSYSCAAPVQICTSMSPEEAALLLPRWAMDSLYYSSTQCSPSGHASPATGLDDQTLQEPGVFRLFRDLHVLWRGFSSGFQEF